MCQTSSEPTGTKNKAAQEPTKHQTQTGAQPQKDSLAKARTSKSTSGSTDQPLPKGADCSKPTSNSMGTAPAMAPINFKPHMMGPRLAKRFAHLANTSATDVMATNHSPQEARVQSHHTSVYNTTHTAPKSLKGKLYSPSHQGSAPLEGKLCSPSTSDITTDSHDQHTSNVTTHSTHQPTATNHSSTSNAQRHHDSADDSAGPTPMYSN